MKVTFEKMTGLDYHTNEAYKTLRTNVSFCGTDVKVIALTSATPNEGKSRVSFLLAKAFADNNDKVLFIDADIRKSVLVSRYGVDKQVEGLSHYLTGQADMKSVICESNIENMDVVFTGQVAPNPSELLGSERFEKLLNHGKENYDYVIVDCPPVGSVIDAAVAARYCDGVILVIESDGVSYKMLQKVKKQMEQSGCKMLGAVLNKVEIGGKGYGYGKYYGKYYSKYYGRYYGSYYDNYGENEKSE